MLPQLVNLESQDDMNVADGATIEPRSRINRPDDENEDARIQEPGLSPNYNTFNVQRHLISASTHRAFRASAMNMWREAVAVA
jgi:hypothetical protein